MKKKITLFKTIHKKPLMYGFYHAILNVYIPGVSRRKRSVYNKDNYVDGNVVNITSMDQCFNVL